LEELCRALPSDAASGAEDVVGHRIPSTLRGIIQVRVERLPEQPARLIRAASVLGAEPDLRLLSRVSGVQDLAAAVQHLVESDLVHPSGAEGKIRFKHWTTRDVVYDMVRLPERRQLHGAVAKELSESATLPPYEELAYHLAGSDDYERAAHFAELAGDRASAASFLDRARQQYKAALETVQRLPPSRARERRWISLVDKWAAASLYSPAEEHLDLIQRARDLAERLEDSESMARAEAWLAWFCYALGDQVRAVEHCRAALQRRTSDLDARLRSQLVLVLAQSLAAAGDYPEAIEHFEAGLQVKRQSPRPNAAPRLERRAPLGLAYALACKGLLHGDLGEFGQARECLAEALGMLHGRAHAVEGSCLGVLGIVQTLEGNWTKALDAALRAQATAERVNGPYVFAMSRMVSGYARFSLERSPNALDDMLQSVKWMDARGARLFISFNYAYLADALSKVGQTDRAVYFAKRALARAEDSDRLGEALGYRVLARIYGNHPDRRADALLQLERAASAAALRGSRREAAMTALEAAKLRAAWGEPEAAARSATTASAIFAELGMTRFGAEAERLLGP
jgi:tetratricopeptide (TPR) repeat protein